MHTGSSVHAHMVECARTYGRECMHIGISIMTSVKKSSVHAHRGRECMHIGMGISNQKMVAAILITVPSYPLVL